MSALRGWLRHAVPLPARQQVAQARRRWRDWQSNAQFSQKHLAHDISGMRLQAEIRQPILPSALFENKLKNLALGSQRISSSMVLPNQHWSFWNYVQQPTHKNDFLVGRNLVNGQLTRQIGGGLCQLSSLIYHLALSVGLNIVERHPHSIDIYQEHERFTPLGADATVVWGFKDLRLANPHSEQIVFECFVEDFYLVGRVFCANNLPEFKVTFLREQLDSQRVLVNTLVNERGHTQTHYLQKQGLSLVA